MARPERHDCDYFPFYARDGKTLHILEGKYGCKGTGFFTNVMRFLTLQEDHHFCIEDEADSMYFFSKCHCDEESGMEMLNIMSKTRKIHTELWVSYKVIVSIDLLKSLSDAYRNRKNPIITIDQILVTYNHNPQEPVVSSTKNTQEPVVSDTDNTQTKLKETKGKKSNTKGKKPKPPKSVDEVIKFFKENGFTKEAAINAFEYYKDQDPPWHDSNGKPVLSWKSKMRAVWFKEENKSKCQGFTEPLTETPTPEYLKELVDGIGQRF